LPALPGAPGANVPVDVIASMAAQDAISLASTGFTAVLVENFHDAPFAAGSVAPETVASMAVVVRAVVVAVDVPVGVNVLRNDGLAALGVAAASGASFIRVNVLAGAAVTDQGLIEGDAHTLLRRRAALGVDVAILADVDVKHATSLDTRPLAERAVELVQRSLADAVLVTGTATGSPVDHSDLAQVQRALAPVPVLAASGTTTENLGDILDLCGGAVIGTALKHPDTGRVDPDRAAALIPRNRP
jgi:membrane complex biogenesis BtpA family protein